MKGIVYDYMHSGKLRTLSLRIHIRSSRPSSKDSLWFSVLISRSRLFVSDSASWREADHENGLEKTDPKRCSLVACCSLAMENLAA